MAVISGLAMNAAENSTIKRSYWKQMSKKKSEPNDQNNMAGDKKQ